MHPILAALICSGRITKVMHVRSYFEVGVLRMDAMHKLLLIAPSCYVLYNHDNSVYNISWLWVFN